VSEFFCPVNNHPSVLLQAPSHCPPLLPPCFLHHASRMQWAFSWRVQRILYLTAYSWLPFLLLLAFPTVSRAFTILNLNKGLSPIPVGQKEDGPQHVLNAKRTASSRLDGLADPRADTQAYNLSCKCSCWSFWCPIGFQRRISWCGRLDQLKWVHWNYFCLRRPRQRDAC
jgi:hypothetical protein